MNKQSEERLIFITQKLRLLSIERLRLITEESHLQHELNSILITSVLNQPNISSSELTHQAKGNFEPKKTFRDSQGSVINIGDAVSFLTPTKFKDTEGIVHSFSPKRVISLNSEDRKVVKDSKNLLILKKDTSNLTKSAVKKEH